MYDQITYDYEEAGRSFTLEDPPLARDAAPHMRAWMNWLSSLHDLVHINTMDLGGIGPYADTDSNESSSEELIVRRAYGPGYVTDYGWLTYLTESGGGYGGAGGYWVQEHGDYGHVQAYPGYAWVPNEASGGTEGVRQAMNRMPGILSIGYEYALQGMLTPPDQLYGYPGTLPMSFQPQIQIPAPWLQPAVP